MKRKIGLPVLGLILVLLLSGCEKISEVGDEISLPHDAFADLPAQSQSHNPEAGAPPIIVAFAPENYALHPEEYEVHHFVQTEYGADIMLTPVGEVRNFQYFAFDNDRLFNYNEFIIDKVLFTAQRLTQEKPFVTRMYIEGYGGPFYGISFDDAGGCSYRYIIYESGEDGSYYLEAF